ncbi:MAG: cupin domain-containing protein [Sagittula sp.]|jgi:anti-sigma factor ChrR (cupin superfamily)|uniref:cupin domain-containing protein n=1 Tax=unclassified Sagittula TaxID=2624628 RepID=UPI0024C28D69|nr:cupin domain-containing protein [Sagittula sp. MA-2]WHZ34557.1 cupin domain-containing protein [Sagittula sp. MA-2]
MPEPLSIADLTSGSWRDMTFAPFRDGIEMCTIAEGTPQVALLRYEPGAAAPRHRHSGMETVLVLDGSQSDENGHYPTGSLVLNPEGSVHTVRSDEGCVVLIQWTKPVEFLEGD